jgi:tetratricopeptide (TPR) repeat protein
LIRSAPVPQTGESDAHFRHAAQNLETASQLVPYNSDYLFRQAEANLRIGQVDKAESLIAQAKLIDPMKPDAYLLDANVQLSGPNPNPAVVRSDFATLLKLNPNDVSLHIQYGDALQHLGLTSEAREQYRQALSANDALPAEEPKRLPTSQVADLQAKLR